MTTAADGRDWWIRILAGGGLTAAEHIEIAEKLMAFSERTARVNPEGVMSGRVRLTGHQMVAAETERAKVHALIAQAISLASLASRSDLP